MDNEWQWTNHQSWTWTDWGPNQPNELDDPAGACVVFWKDQAFQWADAPCDYSKDLPYVCETTVSQWWPFLAFFFGSILFRMFKRIVPWFVSSYIKFHITRQYSSNKHLYVQALHKRCVFVSIIMYPIHRGIDRAFFNQSREGSYQRNYKFLWFLYFIWVVAAPSLVVKLKVRGIIIAQLFNEVLILLRPNDFFLLIDHYFIMLLHQYLPLWKCCLALRGTGISLGVLEVP